MNEIQRALDSAAAEFRSLRAAITKRTTRQVSANKEREQIKRLLLKWFNEYRQDIALAASVDELKPIDQACQRLLESSTRASLRSNYKAGLKQIESYFGKLLASSSITLAPSQTTAFIVPDFASLIADPKMRAIVERRWIECNKVVNAGAPLASAVMIGGLLESLLLARINQLNDKKPIFSLQATPRDKAGKALPLKDWGLRNFIDVAAEMEWISGAAKGIGEVVRDYRNYIHPNKELQTNAELRAEDANLIWQIAQQISKQILSRAHSH